MKILSGKYLSAACLLLFVIFINALLLIVCYFRYMGTSKTDRYLYIILEYVTGGSIAGMITQFGPFTEKLIK